MPTTRIEQLLRVAADSGLSPEKIVEIFGTDELLAIVNKPSTEISIGDG